MRQGRFLFRLYLHFHQKAASTIHQDNASWDDLIYEIYVREVIEEGLADSRAGKVLGVGELRKKYGLTE